MARTIASGHGSLAQRTSDAATTRLPLSTTHTSPTHTSPTHTSQRYSQYTNTRLPPPTSKPHDPKRHPFLHLRNAAIALQHELAIPSIVQVHLHQWSRGQQVLPHRHRTVRGAPGGLELRDQVADRRGSEQEPDAAVVECCAHHDTQRGWGLRRGDLGRGRDLPGG